MLYISFRIYIMVDAKKPRARRYRRARKVPKKKYSSVRRRTAKKTLGHSHINVQSKGIMTTYSKDYKPSSKFGKMMQKKYWIGAKTIQVISNPFNITTVDNRQNYLSYGLYTATDLYTMLTADNQQGGATGTVKNTNRLFLNNCTSETLIANNNNFPCEVTCYRMTTKKDTNENPGDMWQQGINNSAAGTGTNYASFYGVTPFESVKLSQFYKIQRITHLTLQAGGTHKASLSIDLNRVINNEYIQELYSQSPITESLADITTYLLWVVRGYPQQSTATAGSVQSEACSVNFISTEKYTWKLIQDATTNFQYTQATSFGAAVTSTVFNIGSGANVVAANII